VTGDDDPVLTAARIDPRVAAQHPGLRVWSARVPGGVGRTDPGVRERLRMLSDRVRGAQAVAMRAQPVPSAYRVLFRHLGLDPDVTRTPLEALVLDRLLHGGLQPRGLPEDALAIATLETGVPVWAADAQRVGGRLVVEPGADGRLVLADEHGAVAVLFEPPAADRAPHKRTTELLLIAVQAPGVDDMRVEEAVWTAASAMPTIDTPS
jgi:DNA/RNA-binding domain of Phe-tRNA-synthetase-like protein